MSAFGSTAKADNPVYWSFNLETYGARDDWYSTTFIDPGYLQYDYDWQLTDAYLQVAGAWYDILDDILPGDKSGSGTLPGLPFVDELILHIDYPEITADILCSINNDGYGTISIDNVELGWADGYRVTGARFSGDVTITPEPATLSFLALGSLALLRKRRA